MKRLIVTADDFGLAPPVNEAVERAHRDGILSCASLMITAPAAADAVARARRLPSLGVGLHLVFVDGRPALPPAEIPALVGADGRFHPDPVRFGVKLFFLPEVRRQLESELRAQFERFRATGLELDHVDGHHHFHQHPAIVGMLAKFAGEYGIRAVRLPLEPALHSWRAQREGLSRRFLASLFAVARFTGMRARLAHAGIACNDHIFGLHESGRMTPKRVTRFLAVLPEGVSELYCHPATEHWAGPDSLPSEYLCTEEFAALAERKLRRRLEGEGVRRIRFADLARPARAGHAR